MNQQPQPQAPETGQLIRLRQRFWLVQDVITDTQSADTHLTHRLLLECMDDDQFGEKLDVIWEHEVNPVIADSLGLPEPSSWSSAQRFNAFTTAIRWSSASYLKRQSIQAPFHAAIDIEEYQLEPVVRALQMPRVNLLIADDVGLGKTIEAGLVVQEMLSRRRIRRILIVCPASLQQQWHDEMLEKFQLNFEIINREQLQHLRREYGMHVNPWASYPRLITSMDFLKREQPLRLFRESLQQKDTPIRDWDLLIVDEAHNAAPAGRTQYAIDSDRTRMLREITDHFEHRLFLTATPHNGFTESFTALLELLDPLRFSRGPDLNQHEVHQIMIRRLKDDITDSLGRRKFAKRQVDAIELRLGQDETQLHDLLNKYTHSRLQRLDWNRSLAVRFALTMLKKRLLSSPLAFRNSLETHFNTLGMEIDEGELDEVLLKRMTQRVDEDWADDIEKDQRENDALIESTRFFEDLNADERQLLKSMHSIATSGSLPDSKLEKLLIWIEEHLLTANDWNDERLIIFTEYKDTLDYLKTALQDRYGADRIIDLMGGMTLGNREAIKAEFQSPPEDSPVRILVATDAASEGLNLQAHCRYLIHYEIPWNPNRMEQRNGRIDRHGQKADTVYVHHFLYADQADSRFLQTVVEKVETMRADLGSVGDVIAEQVEEVMLGRRREIELPEQRRILANEIIKGDLLEESRIREIRRQMDHTREELSIYPDIMASVLNEALHLLNHDGLENEHNDGIYRLRNLPTTWQRAGKSLYNDRGQLRAITFEHDLARDRRDVVLLHLNHPLMQRAMGVFRKRLWGDTLQIGKNEATLHRTSYRILPDNRLGEPIIMAFGRLIANGSFNQRLHEEVVMVGGEIDGQSIFPLTEDELRHHLDAPYDYREISRDLGDTLRGLYRRGHQQILDHLLADRKERETDVLDDLAAQRAEDDATAIEALIKGRIAELQTKIRIGKGAEPVGQPELFNRDEYLLYQDELLKWYQTKIEQLQERLKSEPQNIRDSYQLRSVQIFPLGLLYLLPQKLVES